jgi:chromosome segregation protein
VHLKSLTLKGFKSFASSTTLVLEPGITCVVGPNGSGKSNVVDAIAWVMGEQGAKNLRGGSMQDVIFAGTTGRAPLGRAEVILTIDNSDGALPIEYSEVTISRTMFRNGGSEYAINGDTCRLLDVQELLSDSGIGREMHVIVGQGQLDQVLHATPDERRGFIEEAAGVLKHRRRKEKALRKLDAMEGNLTRLTDLTGELRRQLKPLGRQAEVARRAVVIQSDVRDARLRLLADDFVQARDTLNREVADETALREHRASVDAEFATAQARESELDEAIAADAPALAQAQDTYVRLAGLRERVAGLVNLAKDRARLLSEQLQEQESRGRDPHELEAQAHDVRQQEFELTRQVEADRAVLAQAVSDRTAAEAALAAEEQRLARAARAVADRREGLATLAGHVAAARSRGEARAAELARLEEQVEGARARAHEAQVAFTALETQVAGLDEGEVGLDAAHQSALDALAAADDNVSALRLQEQEADRSRAALTARVEALEGSLQNKDGAAELVAVQLEGLLGSLASRVRIEPGYEHAVAAALGPAADALAVSGLDSAVRALRHLRDGRAGTASMLLANAPMAPSTAAPAGARLLIEAVDAEAQIRGALSYLLRDCVVVDDLDVARAVLSSAPHLTAVTRDGDVLSQAIARGGSGGGSSLLEAQAALDEAKSALTQVVARSEALRFEMAAALRIQQDAAAVVERSLHDLHESDARMAAVAEQLGQFASQSRAASAEADRLTNAITAAQAARASDLASVAQLEQRLRELEETPVDDEPTGEQRELLAVEVDKARQSEVDARLAVRTGEERARAEAARAEQLEKAAAAERVARAKALERRERREREGQAAAAVSVAAVVLLDRVERSLAAAEREREDATRLRAARDGELLQLRTSLRELAAELERLTDSVHRDEVARAEQRLRLEAIEQKAMEDFGVESDSLVAEYGPDIQVLPSLVAPGDDIPADAPDPQPYPYVREEQERRLKTAERALALLGRVNPLALEEFDAMEERHRFLTEQLEDLKRSRNDLLSIIKEVDDRVQQVFSAAFADVEREFTEIFSRLFPGGEGRLVLTDPDNVLTTGIEIEARPPGKKVKRLQLLSGGERSLTAVAFLVALFKARPSPFYILDEVEAALDDTNLGRLIGVLAELRSNSQLVIVTHQKRTMEIADALYGVSMRGDGVSAVISQRLRDPEDETQDLSA